VGGYSLGVRRSLAGELEEICLRSDRRKVVNLIGALKVDPRPQACERLAVRTELYRVRVGRFRVLYAVDDGTGAVHGFKVTYRTRRGAVVCGVDKP
jgi:mRNA-degrading endonuclease RelE of RelBE toxin-antitoxin system